MCINTGLAEAGLENIEPQKGTETFSMIKFIAPIQRIREYRTPEGDGNQSGIGFPLFHLSLENIEPQKGTETLVTSGINLYSFY